MLNCKTKSRDVGNCALSAYFSVLGAFPNDNKQIFKKKKVCNQEFHIMLLFHIDGLSLPVMLKINLTLWSVNGALLLEREDRVLPAPVGVACTESKKSS